jgi:hypothetical protein
MPRSGCGSEEQNERGEDRNGRQEQRGTEPRHASGTSWIGPDEREDNQVINPATGKPIAEVTVATVDDAQTALEDVTSPTG